MESVRGTVVSVGALLVLATACLADPPDKWEPEIQKFEEAERNVASPRGANLFVGSSSIRMWKLEAGFPKHDCINRGFGGSQMADAAKYADRIVTVYKPRVVVLYSGDNDIGSGKSPATVRDDYKAFKDKVRSALPDTRIVVISVKPSPSRWKLHDKIREANRLIREEMQSGKNEVFVDVWHPMLGDDGLPRPELFQKDQLHLNETGYEIWNKLVQPHLVAAD